MNIYTPGFLSQSESGRKTPKHILPNEKELKKEKKESPKRPSFGHCKSGRLIDQKTIVRLYNRKPDFSEFDLGGYPADSNIKNCGICNVKFKSGDKIEDLPNCGHRFCQPCMKKCVKCIMQMAGPSCNKKYQPTLSIIKSLIFVLFPFQNKYCFCFVYLDCIAPNVNVLSGLRRIWICISTYRALPLHLLAMHYRICS